ncbi:aldehyde dehydrogenase (NAD+) [Pseudonocardia eucalypti]|uniref:aldehyde dehydrogenase family protein n=1 Tax=Pseudonocardia eucalypti TaxID=648755 RepID=UPI001821DDF0|nr:aldehyde dehydrogenase (NAD+) [Pseudonocardia eucalypti]
MSLAPSALPRPGQYVGGEWRNASGAGQETVLDPATGAPLGAVPNAGPADVAAAVAAARAASDAGGWAEATPRARSEALYRLADELSGMVARLLDVVVAETGCPVRLARSQQVELPLRHLEYWAEAARRPELTGRAPVVTPRPGGPATLGAWAVRREPYGVVAAITPYNFPLLENVMKLGPALAAGNTVVLKPSPYTPYSALLLAEAAERAGLPAGVLNVVTGGAEVGAALTRDARVDLVSFTGSDAVGAHILAAAAPRLTKVLLELGGKSALLVCADADLELAARIGARNITTHAGQGCVLATRHLVHASVLPEYLDRLAAAVTAVRVGPPRDPATGMGPLIRPAAVERVAGYVAGAVRDGAGVLTGGSAPTEPTGGFYYRPTVLTGVGNDWPVAREEIFGPVGVVIGFGSEDEAVALANDSAYGLAGHVVSRDAGRAFQLAGRLRTGTVDINGGPGYTNPDVPFGGRGRSGLGRENGAEGLDEYTQLKTIKFHGG